MNEKGLVANVLYLVESDYGTPLTGKKALSLSAWGQYVLDSFATVDEAVEAMKKSPFYIVAAEHARRPGPGPRTCRSRTRAGTPPYSNIWTAAWSSITAADSRS